MNRPERAPQPGLLTRAIVANTLFFLAGGVGIGAWAASLPAFSARAGLSKGDLGLVLLCFAVGAILTMLNVGRWLPRLGASHVGLFGAGLFGAALALAPHSPDIVALAAVVALAGATFGALDVAMNTEASRIEQALGRPLMSTLHALFSVGNLLGAGVVGWLLREGADVTLCLGVAGGLLAAIATAAWSVTGRAAPGPAAALAAHAAVAVSEPIRGGASLSARTYLVGLLAFVAMFSEGALLDWAAVFLVQNRGASESAGAFGFAVFAASMALGRFGGDAATRRFGAAAVVGAGGLAVSLSVVALLAVPVLPLALLWLAIAGLGVANIIPLIFSAAGRIGGPAGASMSRVVSIGYAGLLVGPAFMGAVAEFVSLEAGLAFVAGFMTVVVLGKRLLAERPAVGAVSP